MLTDWISWRWGLFINVPIGLSLVLLAPRYLPETERQPGRFDLTGAATSTLGMTTLVYGFVRAASDGWADRGTIAAFVAGAALLAAFVLTEVRAEQPITPLRLFVSRERSGAYIARILLVSGMFGMFFFLTQYLQGALGFSPLAAGLAFLPMTVAMFGMVQVVPRIAPRVGNTRLMIAGLIVALIGMAWLSRISIDTQYFPQIALPMMLLGVGAGVAMIPLTGAGIAGVAPRDAGAASGARQRRKSNRRFAGPRDPHHRICRREPGRRRTTRHPPRFRLRPFAAWPRASRRRSASPRCSWRWRWRWSCSSFGARRPRLWSRTSRPRLRRRLSSSRIWTARPHSRPAGLDTRSGRTRWRPEQRARRSTSGPTEMRWFRYLVHSFAAAAVRRLGSATEAVCPNWTSSFASRSPRGRRFAGSQRVSTTMSAASVLNTIRPGLEDAPQGSGTGRPPRRPTLRTSSIARLAAVGASAVCIPATNNAPGTA